MKTIDQIKQRFLVGLIVLSGLTSVQADVADAVFQKIDNTDAQKVEIVGDWQTSTWTGGGEFYASNYIHDKNTGKGKKKVRFRPELTNCGYSVYLRYTSGSNRADNVPVDIHHAEEVSTKAINQKQNGGKWIFLGSYVFTGDGTEFVEIRNDETNGYVIADAVAFVELSSGSPCLSNLVSYWNFDQPGEVLVDRAGSNTGWINGAVEGSGKVNTCLEFDGNDSILVADDESLRLVDAFTLCAWVKESESAQHTKIISRRDGDYFYFLGMDNGRPYAGVGDGDSYTTSTKSKIMPSNEWHHLAVVYRADTNSLKLFYDGNLIETVQVVEDLPYTEGIALSIGSDEEGTEMFFSGAIDDLAVFNAALPDDDILKLYMKGLAGNDYCAESLCGNKALDPGEECDGGAGCPSNCRYGKCYATRVVDYVPGLRKDGTPILPERSDPGNAIGAPQGTDTVNFVSLGFGGMLILEFDSRIINRAGNDFKITETSYNKQSCAAYPETAHVYGSKDGDMWVDLGTGCLDSEYDLGALDYATFIKIVDESDPAAFANSDEGFDVDGIEAFSCGQQNSRPVANDDLATTPIDVPVVIHMLFNDTSADGGSLRILEFTQAADGVVTENENGSLTYTPHDGFEGADAFMYTVSDGEGGTDIANVLVTVTDASSPPAVSLNAIPSIIEQGGATTLKWISSRARSVSIDNSVGDVALNSDEEAGHGRIVFPGIDTIYTITATGPGGTATDSVIVTVKASPPAVDIFADREAITLGEPIQLFWNSANAHSVQIDREIGPVSLNSGDSVEDIIAYPQTTTVYTITAIGPGGTVTDSITVHVETVLTPSVSIVAAADHIVQGETSWLYWHSTNADMVTIDQDIGTVAANGCYGGEGEGYPVIISGECSEGKQVAPWTTTTYTITAAGPGGTITDSVTITVNDAPPTVEIVAVPEEIRAGDSTWLYWHSSHADTVVIDQDIGTVAANGCHGGEDGGFWEGAGDECGPGIEVSPQDTITYTITAIGPGGTATDSVTVLVSEPTPPSVDIIADPEMIESGDQSWLYWHSANAELVSISQNIGIVAANGCSRDGGSVVIFPLEGEGECGEGIPVSPGITTTYTITSMSPGGIAVDSVTVYVDEVPPPTVTLTSDPGVIDSGENSRLTWEAANVESISIDHGIGNLYCDIGYGGYGGYGDCDNYVIVTPYVTTTYTITAIGPGGVATDSVTVYVDEVPPPTVAITADPESIQSGNSSWLTWQANKVESVSIDQGIGNLYCDIGYGGYGGYGGCANYVIVAPAVTTTYTITAAGPGGTVTDSVTVYVDEAPPPVVSLGADPESIQSGDSSWLTWEATNVESVSIDQGIGNLVCDIGYGGYGGYGDCTDYIIVSPAATTTYTITAAGPGGVATDSVTVYVDEDPLPMVTLTANPATIELGDISWLTWQATDATTVSIDQGIGNLVCDVGYGGYGGYGDCDNVVIVAPTITTTYTITATGPGGTATDSVTVYVGDGSVPTANFYAEPTAVFRGGSTTLRWQTNNAVTAAIDQGLGEVSLNSDETGLVVSPETTTTYTLTVTGPGGQGTIRVTVIVLEPLIPLVDLMALPETVSHNQPATLAWASSSADTVFIETDIGSDIGEVELNSDIRGLTVTPPTTTTYTITATGPGGTATDTVTVKVLPDIGISSDSWSGYYNIITAGDSSTLTINAKNAETVGIDQGIGDVQMTPDAEYESNGTVTVAPLERTTYTITAIGNGGTSTRAITIDVAPDLEFHTDQEIIESGVQAHLHWTTFQADTVTISPDTGDVALNSEPEGLAVSPDKTTTYTLTAKGHTNTISSSVTIYVNDLSQPPAVISFYVNNPIIAPVINPGQTARLVWETANIQAARIDNGIGDVPLFGSMEVSPEHTTTYTLVVQGPQGMVTEQATVRVRGSQDPGSFGERYEDLVPDSADDLDSDRFSILTGRCIGLEGAPIAGVTVSILGKPEFGETLTDGQGLYSLPVKGNNRYAVVMAKEGFLTTHRRAEVLNNRIAVLDTAAMIEPDSVSSMIDFSATPETILFHGGQYLTDERGERRFSITIPYSETFDEPKNVVTTEYPIQAALPAPLPPNTAFAFAAEIGVDPNDEEDTALSFDEPVIAWIDNFLGFTVGHKVPVGWYDRNEGLWIPSDNGIVVRLLDSDGDGDVDGLDINGDAQADDLDGDGDNTDETIGLPPGEVQVGATYYRFIVDRTGPWALGWPYAAMDAPAPTPSPPYYDMASCPSGDCDLIEKDIAVPGTDFFLHYSEARVSAYQPIVTIPVTGETVPAHAEAVIVRMTVAGKVYEETLSPGPEQTIQFQWDGKDFLGQDVTRPVFAEIAVGYAYNRNYAIACAFNHAFSQAGRDGTVIAGREQYIVWHHNRIRIDRFTSSDDFLADGWTLSAQHQTINSGPATLYLGNGELQSSDGRLITHEIMLSDGGYYGISGFSGNYPGVFGMLNGIAVDDDSERVYWSNGSMDVIWSFGTDQKTLDLSDPYYIPTPFAGDYTRRSGNVLIDPMGVAIDGSGIYYAESGKHIIRKADYFGNRYGLFAGRGREGYSGDSQSAIGAAFADPGQIALDHWGNLFIIDRGNHVIRRVSADGIIETIAGNGIDGSSGDNGPALAASISPADMALDAHGNIFIAEPNFYKVRKIDVSGIITTVAGTGVRGDAGIGGPAVMADLLGPKSVAVNSLGTLLVGDDYRVLEVDSNSVIHKKIESYSEYNKLFSKIGVMTTDMQDRIYLNSRGWRDVYKISPPDFADMANAGVYTFLDSEGQQYNFSALGKHLTTGASTSPTHTFSYDLDNLLTSVLDAGGETILTINRDADGKVLSLETSGGITTLTVDGNNRLVGLLMPDATSANVTYNARGLITDFATAFSGSIQGIVTDGATGEPLGNVSVTLTTNQGMTLIETTDEGSYTFTGIEPGEYSLEFSHAGYNNQVVAGAIIFGDSQYTHDVVMLIPSIQGVVTDSTTGDLLNDVTVNLITSHGTATLQTGADGRYRFDNFEAGEYEYTIEFHKDSYFVETVTGTIVTNTIQLVHDVAMAACPKMPVVSIWASSSYIHSGERAQISWSSLYATSRSIDNGIGGVPSSGGYIVAPGVTTTFTITVTGPGGTATASVTIRVSSQQPTVQISATPEAVLPGESSTLSWSAANASICTIAPDIGQVDISGSLTVVPTETTTYTITASGSEGTAFKSVTVFVLSLPAIEYFQATPDAIKPGETSTLSWAVSNVNIVTIDNGIGVVANEGSVTVRPGETTTYTITATGPEGTSTESVTVSVVKLLPVIEYFQASPDTIPPGAASTLRWSVLNANEVTIDNGIGVVAYEGSVTVSPEETTTYTISAIGSDVTVAATATVTVNYPLPTIIFSADPQVIVTNQTSTLTWETTNASEVFISYIGGVGENGSQSVSPDRMRTYILTATGPGGTAEAVARVFVYKGNQYDYGDPTPAEQAHLETLNRARLNPDEEAARLGIDLNEGLATGTISADPVQPLTFNALVMQAAHFHTQDMMAQQYWTHSSLDGRMPKDRISDAGYPYRYTGENLHLLVDYSPLNETETVLKAHDDLFIDQGVDGRGHRKNIFDERFKEFGIGVIGGEFLEYPYAYMTTCNFASSRWRANSFILGVVYDDINEDGFYTPGEGLADVEITIHGVDNKTVTASAGGYGVPVPPGDFTVTARLPNGLGASRRVSIFNHNIKVDFLRSEFTEPPTVSFGVDDNIILRGESATLDWIVAGAETITINNGVGSVTPEDFLVVTPTSTTTYTLTALGAGGIVFKSITVYVIDPSAVPTATMTVDSLSLVEGESTTLNWYAADADTVSIDNGIGIVEPSGSVVITPASTTTYNLTASGSGGNTAASITVMVRHPKPTASISASPDSVNAGGSTTLTWQTMNADTVSITPGVGVVNHSGSFSVSPSLTTLYTLTAVGLGGTESADVQVNVVHPEVDIDFEAAANTILAGGSVLLSWNVSNATSVSIDNGIGAMATSGSVSVSPPETTVYTLTAAGPAGTATEMITIIVANPADPPAVAFYSSPAVILPGSAVTVSWFVVNAETISINNGIGVVDANGSVSVSPAETTVYTLTATGPGGTTTESVTLHVSDIVIEITSPADGEVINRSDVMVSGTINNVNGNETGVTVNGVLASVHGTAFAANHVPLREGENTIAVMATDTTGDSNEASIVVTAQLPEDYIRIIALAESGTAPFETTLRVDGSFGFTAGQPTYAGPGTVLFSESSEENEFTVSIPAEGVYYFTAKVTDNEGYAHEDTITVLVRDQASIDALLRQKWASMRQALIDGDIPKAATYFQSERRDLYTKFLHLIPNDRIEELIPGLNKMEWVESDSNSARYIADIDIVVGGEQMTISSYIDFELDNDGIWRISGF